VDPATQQLFLSSHDRHRVEVLRLADLRFGDPVPVGSRPWGLALNRTGDTLIVANSGGTNVSFVPTRAPREDVARRFVLPRVTLYDYQVSKQGGIKLDFHNYADRPQYVAQDAAGRLLYSAISTAAVPIGTIRVAEWKPGWSGWESRLEFPCCLLASTPVTSHRGIRAAPSDSVAVAFAIANVDSIDIVYRRVGPLAGPTDRVVIFDHLPGSLPTDPGRTIRSRELPMDSAILEIYGKGSDIIAYPGHLWAVPDAAATADTTFVTVSEDRQWVAFGERSRGEQAGRLMMWNSARGTLSRVEDVRDIVNNSADRLTGVSLNQNGTLGAARGTQATYFFGSDLRLQGSTGADEAGGSGIGFLPASTSTRTYAVEPTGKGTLRVLETSHYTSVGEVSLRAPIRGPFRVGPARPGVAACPADFRDGPDDCVAATVYGVTADRQLLVLDLLKRDLPAVR